MNSLSIYDISAFVHTGMYSRDYRAHGFSVAGAKYFLQRMLPRYCAGHHVLVMFDPPGGSYRNKDMDYKANRKESPEVWAQLDWLYEELQKANVSCYRIKGYEADDLIFNAVEQLRQKFYNIRLYTADYDIAHNVSPNVEFFAANSNVNNLDVRTFSHGINKDVEIMFNSIAAFKVLCWDKSDNIRSFKLDTGMLGLEAYKHFCQFVRRNFDEKDVWVAAKTKDVLLYFIFSELKVSESDGEILKKRINLVFPKKTPEDIVFEPSQYDRQNNQQLGKLANVCGELPKLMVQDQGQFGLSDLEIQNIKRRAQELISGEFSAKRGLRVQSLPQADSSVLNLRNFT